MTSKIFHIFIISFLSLSFLFSARNSNAMGEREASAYAFFIKGVVNSTKMKQSGDFCLLGNDEVGRALLSQGAKIIKISEGEEQKYDSCHSIYIAKGMERGLRIELDRLKEKKILTIAIFDGFANIGGMIQVQLGRRDFELTVNSESLLATGVKLDVLAINLIIN